MKRWALSLVLAALGLVLTVAGAASGAAQATRITLTTALNAAQEVPAATGDVSGARGTFTATATRSGTGATLAWRLTFSGLTGAAGAAHIHTGARGQAGPVAVPLCGPCESGASGNANVDAAVVHALQTGRAYVNVHTAANGAGEVRGQLAVAAAIRTALAARQEVPKPTGNVGRARATFTGSVTKSGSTGVLVWRLTFNRLTGRAAAAHVHIGARGKAGGVAVALCGPCRKGARGRATIRASVLAALEAGRAYVNVHTARNPAGEVRGQIARVPLRLTAGSNGGGGGGGGGGGDPYP